MYSQHSHFSPKKVIHVQPSRLNSAQLMHTLYVTLQEIFFKQKGLFSLISHYLYCYHSYAYQKINQLFVRL